ncbi:MAG: metallophosphoesterase family protein, partial [Halobacteria archaeon]|nr:metallophosphoesterase family protein [Halobacteria archaeon]
MTEIAVLGDSHVPSRAQRVPERVRDEVREADKVVHVGDFDTTGAYDDFSEWASELVAVSGNMDPRMVDL